MKTEWANWLLPAGIALLLAGCTLAVAPGDSTSLPEQPADSAPAAAPATAAPALATPAAATPAADTPAADTPAADKPAADKPAADKPAADKPAGSSADGVAVSGIPGDLLNAVLADAGERTRLPIDALVVTQAEATTWNDGSLGCPEPGMFYTQALVDGYWIIVEAEGQALDYRVQNSGFFRICEQNLPRGGQRP